MANIGQKLNPLAMLQGKTQLIAANKNANGGKSGFSLRAIPGYIQYVTESLALYDILKTLYAPKIPINIRQRLPLIIYGLYFILYSVFIIIPLFFSDLHDDYIDPVLNSIPKDYAGLFYGVVNFLMFIPVVLFIIAFLWRQQRDKNHEEITQNFLQNKITVILKPRGDDKNKWRETYPTVWQAIHRIFRVTDRDVLLQKTPFAAFEILRFGPWLTNNERPDFALAVTMNKENLQSVLTQLQSLHNDMVVDYVEDELIRGISNEKDAKIIWQDFSPAASASSMLQTDTSIDSFRMLSTTVASIPTGVYAAGVQLLVRDALNEFSELNEMSMQMQYTPDQKRKPLDEMAKNQVRELEQKKIYSSEDINYDIVVRLYVVGSDETEMKMCLAGMGEWVQQISGRNSMAKLGEGDDFDTVEERRYPSKNKYLNSVSPLELANIWHIPDVADNISIMARASFRMIAPSQKAIIQEGEPARLIGYYPTPNGVKLPIGLRLTGKNPDICYHTYVIGPTGVGKSVCLQNMIVADMACIHQPTGRPYSIIVLEPHEDLTKDVLIRVPDNREGDVFLIDPTDPWPFGLNMMETSGKPEDVEVDSYNVLSVFAKAMGSSWEQAKRMQRFMGNAVQTIMRVLPKRGEIPTVLHLQAFLATPAYREYVIEGLTEDDGVLLTEWMNFMAKSETEQANILDPAVTRLNTFLNNVILRRIIAQPKNSLNFSKLMDSGSIVLAKMNQKMGESNRTLLGSLIVSAVFKAAMSRGEMDKSFRQPTGFYIDEFATFVAGTGEEVKKMLAEARKMHLAVTLVSQFFDQLPKETKDAVEANTGSKVVFRLEPKDARAFENIFVGKLTAADFGGLQRYMAHLKLMCKENPEYVTVYTYPPPPLPQKKEIESITQDLDAETAKRLGIALSDKKPDVFKSPEQLLGYVMKLNPRAANDPGVHNHLYKTLVSVSPELFAGYQKLRVKWGEAQRQILLKEPGYIPDKKKRIEQLSRLKIGVPAYEIDAILGRLNKQISQIMEERQEQTEEDVLGGGDLFDLGGGSSKSKSGGGKGFGVNKKSKGGVEDDDLSSFFDAF